jgi:DNA-binding NarL/FixJ family response regulator
MDITLVNAAKKLKILVAEDHELLREGLVSLLNTESNLNVVAQASDGMEAVEKTIKFHPNILVLDLSLPILNGYEVIKTVKAKLPDINIIVLSVHNSEEYVHAALCLGVTGYVVKDDTKKHLIAAIGSVINKDQYLSASINHYLHTYDSNQPNKLYEILPRRWGLLTKREISVLKLIAEGYKNIEIADTLFVSVKTVEKHRTNVMHKLNLHNAAKLTAYAIENGFVENLGFTDFGELPVEH